MARRAMSARFLVTSRERLDLPERSCKRSSRWVRYELALFLERARRLRPGLTLEGPALAAAQEVVRLVEGMPLAIELAAARMRVMSAEKLLAGMRQRFRLLTGERACGTRPLRRPSTAHGNSCAMGDGGARAELGFRWRLHLGGRRERDRLSAWPEAPWVVDVVQSLVDKSLLRMRILREAQSTSAARDAVRMYASIQSTHEGSSTRKDPFRAKGRAAAKPSRGKTPRGLVCARTEDAIEGSSARAVCAAACAAPGACRT